MTHYPKSWFLAASRCGVETRVEPDLITAAFSSDGRHILTGCIDGSARIWEILTLDDIERILSK